MRRGWQKMAWDIGLVSNFGLHERLPNLCIAVTPPEPKHECDMHAPKSIIGASSRAAGRSPSTAYALPVSKRRRSGPPPGVSDEKERAASIDQWACVVTVLEEHGTNNGEKVCGK